MTHYGHCTSLLRHVLLSAHQTGEDQGCMLLHDVNVNNVTTTTNDNANNTNTNATNLLSIMMMLSDDTRSC